MANCQVIAMDIRGHGMECVCVFPFYSQRLERGYLFRVHISQKNKCNVTCIADRCNVLGLYLRSLSVVCMHLPDEQGGILSAGNINENC